jgi:DNA-binding transcriptional LysR family regulator
MGRACAFAFVGSGDGVRRAVVEGVRVRGPGTDAPISLKEVAEDDWIFASTDGFLVQACRDVGFDPHIVATTTEPLATRGLIARGLGIGWVPSLVVDEYSGITIRPIKEPIRRRDIYALLPPGDRHPRAGHMVRALVETAAGFDGSRHS